MHKGKLVEWQSYVQVHGSAIAYEFGSSRADAVARAVRAARKMLRHMRTHRKTENPA